METLLHPYQASSARITALPEFVTAIEYGYHEPGRHSFCTAITEPHDLRRYAVDCLDEIDIVIADAGWGADGLVIDFRNQQDLSLFSLAFRGPRSR